MLIGAAVAWDQYARGEVRELSWTDVTARLSGVEWPRSLARSFSDAEQLERELERAQPLGPPRAPAFDFERHRLVLAAAGPRSSTGYAVEILRVVERRDRIDVRVREVTPSLGDRVEPRVTFPYRLIAIPSTDKRVEIRWEGR